MREFLLKHRKIEYILMLCFGALACLPVIFPKIGFLQWVTMSLGAAVMLVSAEDIGVKYRRMYALGFSYFMGFYLVAFHWFVTLYPLSFINGMTKGGAAVVVLFGWVGLSLLQTVVSAFFPVVLALMARRGICKKHKLLLPVGAAATYTVFEWMQTLTWAGVPWARLGIGQTEASVMIKSASLFGSYFITVLLVAVNFYVAKLILSESRNIRRVCAAVSAVIIAVNAAIGGILTVFDGDEDEKFTAAAIQANISSQEKWSNELIKAHERVEKYALEAAENGAKLIVCSESVFPTEVLTNTYTKSFLKDLAVKCDATLIVGCFSDSDAGSHNSLICIDPQGNISEKVYSKRHLVPFGEYVPMRDLIMTLVPPLAQLSMLGEDLVPGEDSAIWESEVGAIGGLICFDSIYEELTLASVRDGAELLVIGTNDSWFYDSAGVRMHNAQARLRAVESGRYIVRAANTGISSIIDPNGKVLDTEAALVEGYVIADVATKESRTLYSYVGNLIVWMSMGFVALAIFERRENK